MSTFERRIAAAPISWGVCEVPGWGHQLAAERVLAEVRALGLGAVELGPDGFLPAGAAARAALLAAFGLEAAGGFVALVLHDPGRDPLPDAEPALDALEAAGAGVLVLAATGGRDGYDTRPALDEASWRTLLANLDRLTAQAAARGVRTAFHPHVGTLVETPAEVERVLAGSRVPLCLDTGHLLIGGSDPLELARRVAGRVAHVHLKDVDGGWARRVQAGQASYGEAVRGGIYRPLGGGVIDLAAVVAALEAAGYDGWYVMEQDTALASEPAGEGPVADVRASLAYLRRLAP